MLKFNSAMERILLSDEIAVKSLDEFYQSFIQGDKSALMGVLILCARFQAVIPDWAADELLSLEERLDSGELEDLNNFFGFTPLHKGTIRKNNRICEAEADIYAALVKHRLDGGNFSIADGLDKIADELGISRRDVEAVYKKYQSALKRVPKNLNEEGYGYFSPTICEQAFHRLRRRGRPFLKD